MKDNRHCKINAGIRKIAKKNINTVNKNTKTVKKCAKIVEKNTKIVKKCSHTVKNNAEIVIKCIDILNKLYNSTKIAKINGKILRKNAGIGKESMKIPMKNIPCREKKTVIVKEILKKCTKIT